MGIDPVELLGEGFDPGVQGTLATGARERRRQSWPVLLLRVVAACAILGLWAWLAFALFEIRTPTAIGITGALTLLYLVIAFFAHPAPDTENIGWLGGLLDDPFRYSDDVNRFLLFLYLVLLPGRMIAEAGVDLFGKVVLRHNRKAGIKTCPSCGKQIRAYAQACRHCKAILHDETTRS